MTDKPFESIRQELIEALCEGGMKQSQAWALLDDFLDAARAAEEA